MDKAAVYFPRLLLGIKKAHHDVICEQYPMPDGKINIFVEFSNSEITSKFPHHQKNPQKMRIYVVEHMFEPYDFFFSASSASFLRFLSIKVSTHLSLDS